LNIPIVNFPFIYNNNLTATAHGVCTYLSDDPIFQSLWFLSWCHWWRFAVNVCITSKVVWSPHDLVYRYGISVSGRTTDMSLL